MRRALSILFAVTLAPHALKAAAQGNALAMSNLASLYEDGRSVPQDLVQAYVWYARASVDDGEYEQEVFDRARRGCDELAKRMTPAQVDEAKRFAAGKL